MTSVVVKNEVLLFCFGWLRSIASIRWIHIVLTLDDEFCTVVTQHCSKSLTELVQVCEVNTICQASVGILAVTDP